MHMAAERFPQFTPRCAHVASLSMKFAPPEMVGEVPDGIRCNFFVDHGVVRGPRFEGEILPRSSDHMIVRRDGVGEVRVRAVIRTGDGALVSAEYQGICDWGQDGYRRLLDGELPDFVDVQTTPRFFTGHPPYEWLNRTQFIGLGRVSTRALSFEYELYALHLQSSGH
jgi:hypothetical protein